VEDGGATVGEVSTVEDLSACGRLFAGVWESDVEVAVNLMRALAHTGNYLAAAYRFGHLVGASVAFVWGSGDKLHSHITGVIPEAQGQGVGYALKLHQKEWAARRGLTAVTWTFDPLVRRNAWFNLIKLGARVDSYRPDFYGPMADGINDGDPTDRCFVSWPVANSDPAPPPPDNIAALVLLAEGPGAEPQLAPSPTLDAAVILCQVPHDIIALRRKDPLLARRWRLALRETMGGAMQDGYLPVSINKDGSYVLTKGRR
jgi:predicted GNAT superfamily acetyltransferase